MNAGYADARSVNGFSNGIKNTESRDDGRWVTRNGEAWLKDLMATLRVDLPSISGESH